MRLTSQILCLSAAFMLAGSAAADDFLAQIMTGSSTGTYIKFGKQISDLVGEKANMSLGVRESEGSLQNIEAVFQEKNVQLGIVQNDVLRFLTATRGNAAARRMQRLTRIAFSLYNEEIHVVARQGIDTLQDLEGQRIGVGANGSGTNVTATIVLDAVGVTPGRSVGSSSKESLAMLVDGRLDAFFYVAGAPVSLLADPKLSQDTIKLVPIRDPALRSFYVPSTLEAGSYPWLPEPVDVVAVKSLMMTYAYETAPNPYFEFACEVVAGVTHLVHKHIDELRRDGHSKWRAVDLDFVPEGWSVSGCAQAGLRPGFEPKSNGAPSKDCSTLPTLIEQIQCHEQQNAS